MDSVSVGIIFKNIIYLRAGKMVSVSRSWKIFLSLFVKGQTLNTLGFVNHVISGVTYAIIVLETGKANT